MDEPRIPAYYIVRSELTEDQQAEVGAALRIHPVLCAIIWRDADRDLAALLAPEIIRANTEREARELAAWLPTKAERPAVVIGGDGIPLKAVYSDGTEEILRN